jgi:hypothetical protein
MMKKLHVFILLLLIFKADAAAQMPAFRDRFGSAAKFSVAGYRFVQYEIGYGVGYMINEKWDEAFFDLSCELRNFRKDHWWGPKATLRYDHNIFYTGISLSTSVSFIYYSDFKVNSIPTFRPEIGFTPATGLYFMYGYNFPSNKKNELWLNDHIFSIIYSPGYFFKAYKSSSEGD